MEQTVRDKVWRCVTIPDLPGGNKRKACAAPFAAARHPGEGLAAVRGFRHPPPPPLPECGCRFTTFERVQLRELIVIKRNGRREPFDRDKLERSIRSRCASAPVERERVERTVSGIVRRLKSMGENEIPANVIGETGDAGPGQLDKVAYVRFASVYKNFREAKDFAAALDELSARRMGG